MAPATQRSQALCKHAVPVDLQRLYGCTAVHVALVNTGCDLMTADGGGVGALPNAVHLWPLPLPMRT
eukprot:SAG31_NODE_1703_length_7495_cov_3.115062_5_plen_67_part_00